MQTIQKFWICIFPVFPMFPVVFILLFSPSTRAPSGERDDLRLG